MSSKVIQAYVSAVVAKDHKAFFQDDIGNILSFTEDMLQDKADFSQLKEGSLISVELDADNKIINVILEGKADDFDDEVLVYEEPKNFVLLGEPPFNDYLLIDYGKYVLAKGDKDVEKAKQRLIDLCKELGANSIIDFKVKEERKNVMGYGFIYHYAIGIPAVVATQNNDQGNVSLNYLQNKLNKQKISKLGNMYVNVKIGKIILNIMAIVLFIIFAIGFFYAN